MKLHAQHLNYLDNLCNLYSSIRRVFAAIHFYSPTQQQPGNRSDMWEWLAPYWLSLIYVRHPWHHIPQHHFLMPYAKGHTENQKRTGNGIPAPSFPSWSSSTALAIGIAPCAGVQNKLKLNRCDCKRQCCSRAAEQQKLLQLTNDLHKSQLVTRGWEGRVLCSICS